MEHVDCPANVQSFSQPAWRCRPRVEPEAARLVLSANGSDRISRYCRERWNRWQDAAVGPTEVERAIGLSIDPVSLLVHSAVMSATEHREIRERRGAAVGPVADVMPLAVG